MEYYEVGDSIHGYRIRAEARKTLGDLKAGSTGRATWKMKIDGPVSGKTIMVLAQGKVSGQVPEAHWTGMSVSYPAYSYKDAIGGNGSIQL